MNSEIELLFTNFKVNKKLIPVSFMTYDGHGEPYIVYSESDKSDAYKADDEIGGYVTFYDFDIYSKGNYLEIMEKVKQVLKGAGWFWCPSRDSADLYDHDTGYFHKTVCFSYPIQTTQNEEV